MTGGKGTPVWGRGLLLGAALASTLAAVACDDESGERDTETTAETDDDTAQPRPRGEADAGERPSDDLEPVPGNGDGVPCPTDETLLAEAFAEAVCSKRGDCCDDDYEVCIVEVTEAFDAIYVDLDDAVPDGSASVDCGAFAACASAIERASCDEWPAQVGGLAEIPVDVPECRKLVTPGLESGDACDWNYQCRDGFCQSEDGLCYDFAKENESCEEALCSLPTHFCNAAGLCQRRLENGVACNVPSECQSGVCAPEDAGVCMAPGPSECKYVPAAPAACALRAPRAASGGWLLVVAGLTLASAARRRGVLAAAAGRSPTS